MFYSSLIKFIAANRCKKSNKNTAQKHFALLNLLNLPP